MGDLQVLVEFPPRAGRQQVALTAQDAVKKSAEALDRSMETIRHMATRVTSTMDSLGGGRPDEVTVEFGIKFDAEAGAIIAKAGVEGSLTVELVWKAGPGKE
jgi:hypothetical protein